MPHIINRLALEINCPDEEQAFNLRTNFAVTLQEKIMAAIDTICSRYSNDSEWIRIDTLELDLGWFYPNSFELEFGELFFKKFEDQFVKQISQLSVAEKRESRHLSEAALLYYFLQYGTLPWWADAGSTDINEIAAQMLVNEEKEVRAYFYQQRFSVTIWQRAAFQLNKENKEELTARFTELQHGMDLFKQWIRETLAEPGNDISANPEDILATGNDILLRNAGDIFQNYPDPAIYRLIFEEMKRLFSPAAARLVQDGKEPVTSDLPEGKRGPDTTSSDGQPGNKTGEAAPGSFLDHPYLPMAEVEQPDAKSVVKHAGIILLGAFLNAFFTNLNLLNGAEWKSKETQYRAVHLLKFLSTGEQRNPEFNLTLEKILCGLNTDESLPVDIVLTDAEMSEAQGLLESVIEHWSILKNTSVNGLRESFLKRDGLIMKKEMDWLLQVERKTLDVLIDSIPWGYSTLHFPWMEQKILVEW
jgi:hypothetical protein